MSEARHRNSSFRDSVPSSSLWRSYTHMCTNPQALTCAKLKIKLKAFLKDFKLTAWKSNRIRASRKRDLKSREQTFMRWGLEKNNKAKNRLYEQINVTGKPRAKLFKKKKRLELLKLQKKGYCFLSYRSKRDRDKYHEKLYAIN